jgi:hypothetical protein
MVSNIRYETLPKFTLKDIKEKPFHFIFILLAAITIVFLGTTGIFLAFVFMIVIGIFQHVYKIIFNKNW